MPKFSVVYPTRNRPTFIRAAMSFLENSTFKDFEVIISDNPSEDGQDCQAEALSSSLENIKYFRCETPITWVENWNFALSKTTGDYVLFLTDKMFLLPETLSRLDTVTSKAQPEIVTWVDNSYKPNTFPEYFSGGTYVIRGGHLPGGNRQGFRRYSPKKELHRKTLARVPREEQSPSHYSRGKICFGAYHRSLIGRIVSHTGQVFHHLSPDYTSMICALSLASSAVELDKPGIVHISTDLSTGGKIESDDSFVSKMLAGLPEKNRTLDDMLVPGLFASQHSFVSHDYISLLRKYGIGFPLNSRNWLSHCEVDLRNPGRVWSSSETRKDQFSRIHEAVRSLPILERVILRFQNVARRVLSKPASFTSGVLNVLFLHKRIPLPNVYQIIQLEKSNSSATP